MSLSEASMKSDSSLLKTKVARLTHSLRLLVGPVGKLTKVLVQVKHPMQPRPYPSIS